MKIGSLFSGIGGLELGIERATGGTVAWQVEVAPLPRGVLEKNWPKATRYGDIKEVDFAAVEPVDIICGGFPCQDLSHAGKRAGLDGDRSGLWVEFKRAIRELGPAWVVIENVHHAWRSWVPVVRGDLHELGFASVPLRMSAAEVGADHERRRCFILAHADGQLLRELSGRWRRPVGEVAAQPLDPRWRTPASRVARIDDGVPFGVDRRRALGNSVLPQCAEQIGGLIREAAQVGRSDMVKAAL